MPAALPPELQQRISFSPVTSTLHFDRAMSRGTLYDPVFIDGNHEFEFARFDLECAARLMAPGGIIVLDNVNQSGPRLATKLFLESHPDWRDIADVVRWINPDDPSARDRACLHRRRGPRPARAAEALSGPAYLKRREMCRAALDRQRGTSG